MATDTVDRTDASTAEKTGGGAGITLLIVDDELRYLAAIAERLRMRGFSVTTAGNGADALEAAKRDRFDVALIDLKMPGMNGQELLRVLKSEHRYLEVIVLTGHGSIDSAIECTKLGAFGYLPKPYELDRLIAVLKDAYQHRLEKKFQHDQQRLEELTRIAVGTSPLAMLRRMRELDDGIK